MQSIKSLINHTKETSRVRSFKKGATLLFQGEIPRHAFIIEDGAVRAYSVKTSGEESIAAIFTKGDIFPLSWALSTTPNTLYYYEAMSDVRATCTPKSAIQEAIDKHPEVAQDLLKYINSQYTSMLVRITGLSQSRAIEKISYIFYFLLLRYGIESKDGIYKINLKLNHSIIASLTGLTRESTTTNLGSLKEKGVISYTRSSYAVDKLRLERFIGEDGFRELSL